MAYLPFTTKTDQVSTIWASDVNNLQTAVSDLSFNVKGYGAVGDGTTDDQTAFDAAIAALEVNGGTLFIPPATYNAKISLTANKPVRVVGYGATLKPPINTVAVQVARGNGETITNCLVAGLKIDGSNTGVTGILIQDNDGAVCRDIHITDAAKGIRLHNTITITTWVERNGFDHVLLNACTTGIELDPTGTNSFAETYLNNIFINDCTTGIDVKSGANCYRTKTYNVVVWLRTTQIGVKIAGDMLSAIWDMALEAISGTPTGLEILSGATNTEWMDAGVHFTGSFGTEISTYDTAHPLNWRNGNHLYEIGDGRPFRYRVQGDSVDRIQMAGGFAGGGGVQFGSGSLLDVNLYRAAADQLKTDDSLVCGAQLIVTGNGSSTSPSAPWMRNANDHLVINPSSAGILYLCFDAGSGGITIGDGASNAIATISSAGVMDGLAVKTKAGAPVDGDFSHPRDGVMALDTTNHRLYVRDGGTWKYAALT